MFAFFQDQVTPLLMISYSDPRCMEIFDALLTAGADANARRAVGTF
jgi:hypothetical protein